MAIKSDYVLKNGLEVKDCYLRIDIMRGNKNKLGFNLVPYLNSESNVPLEEGEYYEFELLEHEDSARWDKQGYEYLKTLEKFKDAKDS